jgi:peptide chain release factor 2
LSDRLTSWDGSSTSSRCFFDLPGKAARLKALEERTAAPEFWGDQETAQKILKEQSDLRQTLDQHGGLVKRLEDERLMLELAAEERDAATLQEIETGLADLAKHIRGLEMQSALSAEYDKGNAILAINAGAGGTESQDWAQMLLRMYMRWFETKRFKAEVIDILAGDDAGIKNVTVTVEGAYAYGLLHAETGVHRLVRISPFDANKRRHTSFASVFVFPDIPDDIDVKIEEKDLRIDVYRSTGHGGQSVNTTDSAVRITHLPTGLVATCQDEKSQHKNKAKALKVLRGRLYERYKQERDEEMAKLDGTKQAIAWGSQIRSYVLAPYQLVKDHRTGEETGNVSAVLDGDVDRFIEAFLFKPPDAKAAAPKGKEAEDV